MRKLTICVALLAVTVLAGCGYTPEQRAATGAGIGAGTGAVIAAAAGASPGLVVASSLLGAGTGAAIGASTQPLPPPQPVYVANAPLPRGARCVDFREDIYGRRYCYAYY